MALSPTRMSRISVGWRDSARSIADLDPADTGAIASFHGPVVFVGAQTLTGDVTLAGATSDLSVGGTAWVGGALTQIGAAALSSSLTVAGAVTSSSSLSAIGAADFRSTVTVSGTLTSSSSLSVIGAADFRSTLTSAGTVTATNGIRVGGGAWIQSMSITTGAISLGAINPLESSSVVTIGVSGATRGDFLAITPDSIYPNAAANRDILLMCSSSSTVGEVHIWGVNSTLTAVTPTAGTLVRVLRVGFPTGQYI